MPLEQWLYFLATSEIPDDADAPGLQEARERLSLSHMDRDEQAAYRRYLDDRVILQDNIITARGEGKLEGRAEGRAEANIDHARKMKALGVDAHVISEVTGLTASEVERL